MITSNFKFNKNKILSLLLASSFSLIPIKGNANVISYLNNTTLKNGKKVFLHYITGKDISSNALIEIDNKLVFIPISDINYHLLDTNNEYTEVNMNYRLNNDCFMYTNYNLDNSSIIYKLNKNTKVFVLCKNTDGNCIIRINDKIGFINGNYLENISNQIDAVKILGNNVNIREDASIKSSVIGFADITDSFIILDETNDWYKIRYLNKDGYISKKYATSIKKNKDDFIYKSIVYLTRYSYFYSDLENNIYTVLPTYQNAFVIDEIDNFYKVMIDGVIGYIDKSNTRKLSNRCIIIDLSRQILRVYNDNKEIERFHIITGREELQTTVGCFKINHRINGYQLTDEHYVNYWIQYNGNEGIHDASWQDEKNFMINSEIAYNNFSKGSGMLFPKRYGSHGCSNMQEEDAHKLFDLIRINDNVLVIGPNNLINLGLISKINNTVRVDKDLIKVKKNI